MVPQFVHDITFKVTMKPKNSFYPQFVEKHMITITSYFRWVNDRSTPRMMSTIKDKMTRVGIDHRNGCNIDTIEFVKQHSYDINNLNNQQA